jgi:acyl-CoA thioesterase I
MSSLALQVARVYPIWTLMARISVVLLAFIFMILPVSAETKRILALGDSLTAGYGLAAGEAFPVKLEAALKAKGLDVVVINAGVSGDTVAQGEARLDWALGEPVDAVIVELGANDALRGLDPAQAEVALVKILEKLKEKNLPVLIAGMRAPPNMGPDYQQAFDAIFPRQADAFGALLYPFFLDGVAADAGLNQTDGIHPNPQGVDIIVGKMLPMVEQLIAKTQ